MAPDDPRPGPLPPEVGNVDVRTRTCSLFCSVVLFAGPVFANSLANPSFEILGPNGSPTVHVGAGAQGFWGRS